MLRKPPSDLRGPGSAWDDDLELEEALDIDDHELDFKLGLDRVGKGTMRPLNIATVPRDEGEGFVEDMEAKMDKVTIEDIRQEMDNDPDDNEPYDDEDYYSFADEYPEDDEDWDFEDGIDVEDEYF